MYTYRAVVSGDAHDGDTLTLDVDLGFDCWIRSQSVRVEGIDTPEINSPDAALRARAATARDRVRFLCRLGTEVKLVSKKYDAREKYGRIIGSIELPDGRDLATLLIAEGHGRPYDGGKR